MNEERSHLNNNFSKIWVFMYSLKTGNTTNMPQSHTNGLFPLFSGSKYSKIWVIRTVWMAGDTPNMFPISYKWSFSRSFQVFIMRSQNDWRLYNNFSKFWVFKYSPKTGNTTNMLSISNKWSFSALFRFLLCTIKMIENLLKLHVQIPIFHGLRPFNFSATSKTK